MGIRISECRRLAALPWCASGFSARGGGFSSGACSSLNLGLHVGDDREAVLMNRARVAERLGFTLNDMVCAEQVHGGEVAIVEAASRGRGATAIDDALPGVDALVTETPGLLLTLFFADCVPVLIADTKRGVIGVVHAGWRGVVSNVVEHTIETIIARFGASAKDMIAAIGPSIGPCCFEVGNEVATRFPSAFARRSGEEDHKPHVDLKGAIASRLIEVGVQPSAIDALSECTACNPQTYFSYRRDSGRTGRMAALIGIRPR